MYICTRCGDVTDKLPQFHEPHPIGGSLLEQAAPDGSLKKYVSFIISMVLLNGLLYPLQTMK